jgi:hypothetical protein
MRAADIPYEAGLLLALRKVQGGHVTVCETDTFSDDGQAFPSELAPYMREPFAHGQIRLEERQGSQPPCVAVTTAGTERSTTSIPSKFSVR